MTNVNKFDHEVFGQLEVVVYDDKPYFVANDVVSITGQKNKSETLKYHCKSLIKLDYSKMLELGMDAKPKGIQLIPEKDVYRLIMNSTMEGAEEFQDWVMEDVLPTIRKTGGFVSDVDLIMETFYKDLPADAKTIIREGLIFRKDNQHKIDFANDVGEVVNLQDMNSVAKALGVGRNKLYAKLREIKILMDNNRPYQRFVDQGYFEVKQTTRNNQVFNVTMVTGKGELYLHKKLKEIEFI